MLFTRCPSCETTFRITDRALQKAGGQVRCGRCSCVFDAYSALREQRDEGEGEGDAGLGSKAGAAGGDSAGSASAAEKASLLKQASEHEDTIESSADSSRIEQVAQPSGAAAASATRDTDDAPANAAGDDGRTNAAPITDTAAAVLGADAFAASGPDAFPATPEADAAEPTSAALDPDEEWLATAALFIVQSAAEPSPPTPPTPSPEPTERAGGTARTGARRRAGTKHKPSPSKAKPQSEPSPADDVLDDYSVAAVLEQIESSSLSADAERLEDEPVEHEPAARGPLEHESPEPVSSEHVSSESEAARAASARGDSARVLTFDANDSRGGTALARDRRRGLDSTHGTPSAPSVSAAHALPHAVRAAKASAAIGVAANLGSTSTGRGANAAPSNAAASAAAASSTPPHAARSAPAAAPPFVKPPHHTRAAANSAWLGASLGALLLLGAQLTNHFRADLVGIDGIGPALRNLYARIGIELIPRWDLGQYRIVDWVATAEPNAKGRGSLRITAQIRNEGRRAQPFPYVHLQLKDRWEKSVASRMFRPSEYLSESTRAEQLMPAGATARAELEVIDPGPDAYGFELDVCIERPDRSVHCAADDVFR